MNQDAYEAIWEYVNGRPLEYAKPRYVDPVHVHENSYGWQPLADGSGVAAKHIGTFNERGVALDILRLEAGARHTLPAAPQTRIVFFKHGTGTLGNGEPWFQHSAMHLGVNESVDLAATETTEAMVLCLPRFD